MSAVTGRVAIRSAKPVERERRAMAFVGQDVEMLHRYSGDVDYRWRGRVIAIAPVFFSNTSTVLLLQMRGTKVGVAAFPLAQVVALRTLKAEEEPRVRLGTEPEHQSQE